MSPDLYKFFCDYQAWLQAGVPEGRPFTRKKGLCGNAYCYHSKAGDDLAKLLFMEFGDNSIFPFEDNAAYQETRLNATKHLNRARNAFVDRMVAQLPPPKYLSGMTVEAEDVDEAIDKAEDTILRHYPAAKIHGIQVMEESVK